MFGFVNLNEFNNRNEKNKLIHAFNINLFNTPVFFLYKIIIYGAVGYE